MIKIIFVCHGNICRSPMAEFVMINMLKKRGIDTLFSISSAATSYEEIGNGIHRGTISKLVKENIPYCNRTAVRLTSDDYRFYDYIIGMDDFNIKNILRIVGKDTCNKVYKLLDFCDGGNVEDPWYTGDFDNTFNEIVRGCEALIDKLMHIKNRT